MEKRGGGAPSGQRWARRHTGSPLVTCCPCRAGMTPRHREMRGGCGRRRRPLLNEQWGTVGTPQGTAGRARGVPQRQPAGLSRTPKLGGGDPLPAPPYPNACKHRDPSPPHRSGPPAQGGLRPRGCPAVPPPPDPSRCPCSTNPRAPCPPVPGCPEPPCRRCPVGPGCGDPAGWVAGWLCPARDPPSPPSCAGGGRAPPPGTEPGCEKQAHHAGMDGWGVSGGLGGVFWGACPCHSLVTAAGLSRGWGAAGFRVGSGRFSDRQHRTRVPPLSPPPVPGSALPVGWGTQDTPKPRGR